MAESMKGLHRSHRCTEVSNQNIGETVTVMGWVQKRRNLGSLIFIDLRDRSGILQLVFNEESVGKEGYEKAERLRSEYVIAVTGKVEKRSAAVNESLKTGDIEVIATDIRILSEAETPPFQIEENSQTKDEVRLKYRYLDLRRPDIQKNLMLRSKVAYLMRDFMAKEGFLEIETPMSAGIYTGRYGACICGCGRCIRCQRETAQIYFQGSNRCGCDTAAAENAMAGSNGPFRFR